MHILDGGLDDPRVVALLHTHLHRARAETAPGSAHALDLSGLRASDVTFWSVWVDAPPDADHGGDGRVLAGVGALRRLTAEHGEVKSMHTAEAMRGRGVASALLRHLVAHASACGMTRVSLETGAGPAFAPARALYAAVGFTPCGPFAAYRPSPNSRYLTLRLDGSEDDR